MTTTSRQNVFRLRSTQEAVAPWKGLLLGLAERALGLTRLQRRYEALPPYPAMDAFLAGVLTELQVSVVIDPEEQARIPATGGALVVANHPFGGVEGVALAQVLRQVRPDVRILANGLLQRIPELAELLIPVDPFGGPHAGRRNLKSMRQAVQWVNNGGLLLVFPAGTVSHLHLRQRRVLDPTWSPTIGRLAQRTGAPVLPLYLPGRNRALFQVAGLISPWLRTLMLPRELLCSRGLRLTVRVGRLLSAKKLRRFTDDVRLTAYLRLQTYLLVGAAKAGSAAAPAGDDDTDEHHPDSHAIRAEEIARLPGHQCLAQSGELQVWMADAVQIPHLLLEIGRLREQTFRLAGEGTGREVDLDAFDQSYQHLLLWNRSRGEVAGAYRVGRSDQLLQRQGLRGLYTSTLFRYRRAFLDDLGPALELGRSFIRPAYQKSYAPLLLLWKGIGAYIVKNPQYRFLFGPVSISRDYSDLSRHLIARNLLRQREGGPGRIRPRNPLKLKPLRLPGSTLKDPLIGCQDLEELAALVETLEGESRSIPVLLRHYLGLGGQLLAFNVDADFADVLDGLILVDLLTTDRRQLDRYMGHAGAEAFLRYQHHRSVLWGRCA